MTVFFSGVNFGLANFTHDNFAQKFRMPLLYHYEFEIGEDITFKVAFYDDKYDITEAESLSQIGSQHRRIWAQRAVLDLVDDDEMILAEMSCFQNDNQFAARLKEENWGQALVRLDTLDTRILLQIYRFYCFNYYYLFE